MMVRAQWEVFGSYLVLARKTKESLFFVLHLGIPQKVSRPINGQGKEFWFLSLNCC